MDSLFCCESITPYKPKRLDHESKFTTFLSWARAANVEQADDKVLTGDDSSLELASYVVQLVRQVNYGALEWKRYFAPVGNEGVFIEISEKNLIDANFKKLNTFKNYKCDKHNKFFEINLYQKDLVNKHHWRADVDRPAGSIDL